LVSVGRRLRFRLMGRGKDRVKLVPN
jgi:hypothetical protein